MFSPQKVLKLGDELKKKNPKLSGEYMITTKLDGWYVVIPYIKGLGWQAPVSSAMRAIPSLDWLVGKLDKLATPNETCFLIAEAIISDIAFPELNGLLNRSKGDCACTDIELHLHDIVFPFKPELTALHRFEVLQDLDISYVANSFKKVKLLEVSSYSKNWDRRFEEQLNKGEEGIILKEASATYQFGKRNSSLLKMKLELEVDLLAVRLEEGIGEKGNDSLTLVSKRSSGMEVRTVIGKLEDKALFRANPEKIIGKVVTVKAMEEFTDGQLRQPVFKWIRYEKEPNDIN